MRRAVKVVVEFIELSDRKTKQHNKAVQWKIQKKHTIQKHQQQIGW